MLYDQPNAGQSKPHNENRTPISKEMRGQIPAELIERFRAEVVMSVLVGRVATLLALAQRPGRIRRAVVNSFSPQLNPAMLDYLHRGLDYLAALIAQVGNLVNETIGRLPAVQDATTSATSAAWTSTNTTRCTSISAKCCA